MYTIKQASARTGLPVPTIRVWERRYGVIHPERTAAGYRLFDDAAIQRLMAMRQLVEVEGWRPSQAAERVLAAGQDVGSLLPDAVVPSTDPTAPAVEAYVAAAHGLDVPEMERVLDEAFASQRFERAVEDVVFPALRAIGEAWAGGDLSVGQEHVASETVRRRLAALFLAAGQGNGGSHVLVGLPPGSQHDLGALAFAVAGRRAGLDVLYLGANVPLESWVRTTRETRAPIVVMAVATAADVGAAKDVVEALRSMAVAPLCALGGPAAGGVDEAPGVIRLPASAGDAVAAVVTVLATSRAGPIR